MPFGLIDRNISKFRLILLIIFAIMLIAPSISVLQNANMKIFAVTDDHKGMSADLYMYTIPGNGSAAFVTSNSLVGKDTQTTGNIAIKVAQKKTGVAIISNDIIFDIRANASEVDGPSAGAAMTLLTYSMLAEKPLPEYVAITGTINSDGSIGAVGGVGPKSQAASQAGIKLFIIPTGEAVADLEENGEFETVNLLEYGPRKLGMKVIEARTIDEAINYAYSNINEIKVDANSAVQIFIPEPIGYDDSLVPMRLISQNYVSQAKQKIDDAQKSLGQSSLPQGVIADLYQRFSPSKRGVEMAQRFFDQNYLYSSANYAFNSWVLAGTVLVIADNPQLLEGDFSVLDTKIAALKEDIRKTKESSRFVPLDKFEWIIGAEQRIAYAENSLQNAGADIIDIDSNTGEPSGGAITQNDVVFEKVYDYVSAEAWVSVSKDFLREAQNSNAKKVPNYSTSFAELVQSKISLVDNLINTSKTSVSSISEAQRRLSSAKISLDNNFLIAAYYDSIFAESFIKSELARKNLDTNELMTAVGADINATSKSDSVWANMYFDHAEFYYQNAVFDIKLGRDEDAKASLETAFDLIYLSKQLTEAKMTVEDNIAFAGWNNYIDIQPQIDVKYTSPVNAPAYTAIYLVILIALICILALLVVGIVRSRQKNKKLEYRSGKLTSVLGNLDKAVTSKKITHSEYFFIKRKYEDEAAKKGLVVKERKNPELTLEDLRAKQRALERALADLHRHHRAGLLITEDYQEQCNQLDGEIGSIKKEIRTVHAQYLEEKSRKGKIKGTKELAKDEDAEEESEKKSRKKVLRKFAFKAKNK